MFFPPSFKNRIEYAERLTRSTFISRYLFKHSGGAIFLVTLVLLLTAWLTQSLRFLEMLANNGIPLVHFLQLILLLLPDLLVVILPSCCLIGSVSTLQRLMSENEILIYQSIGMSFLQIATPFLCVGGILSFFILWIGNSIAPQSLDSFTNIKNTMREDFSTGILRKGVFSKFNGLTIYVEDHYGQTNKLKTIFIYTKAPDQSEVSLFAEKGELIKKQNQFYLHLFKGCRQIYTKKKEDNKIFCFDELIYDLEILPPPSPTITKSQTLSLGELLNPPLHLAEKDRYKMKAEAHKRLLGAYLVFFFILHGCALVLTARYKRGGNQKIGTYAILSGILIQMGVYTLINMIGKSFLIVPFTYLLIFGLSILYFWWLYLSKREIPYPLLKKEKLKKAGE